MCAGNELFFCTLYLLHFTSGPICKYYYNNLFVSSLLMQTTLLKTPNTVLFPRLVVLSPENNHTHPTEGQMTILRGEGVLWGKSPKPYWNFQWCFLLGGGGSGEEGGCSESFQKLLRAGYGYFLKQHNTVKLCKKLCSDQSYYLDLLYVF